MTREILVKPSMDVDEATQMFVPVTPEQALELGAIIATIQTFQKHLVQLSSGNSTIELKKTFRFGMETVVVTCSSSQKSLLRKFLSRFNF